MINLFGILMLQKMEFMQYQYQPEVKIGYRITSGYLTTMI